MSRIQSDNPWHKSRPHSAIIAKRVLMHRMLTVVISFFLCLFSHVVTTRPMTAAVHTAFAKADARSRETLQLQRSDVRSRSPNSRLRPTKKKANESRQNTDEIKKMRSPLFFSTSDGTLKNLSEVNGAENDERNQDNIEVPESNLDGKGRNHALHLPFIFRGKLNSTADDLQELQFDDLSDDNPSVFNKSKNSISPYPGKKKRRQNVADGVSTQQLLSSLQSLPRPSTVPHKPLNMRSQKKGLSSANSNSSLQDTFWAPTSILGMVSIRPTTPMHIQKSVATDSSAGSHEAKSQVKEIFRKTTDLTKKAAKTECSGSSDPCRR